MHIAIPSGIFSRKDYLPVIGVQAWSHEVNPMVPAQTSCAPITQSGPALS